MLGLMRSVMQPGRGARRNLFGSLAGLLIALMSMGPMIRMFGGWIGLAPCLLFLARFGLEIK
nr:MAG TPA: hypothetical protein [Caudoviricetes sp.]